MADAMNQFALRSCIRFVPRTTETDYVHISPETGCNSYIGKIGGRQILSLGDGCIDRAVIIHELMHAVGFWHEHARPDRDQFVEVLFQNVQEPMKHNFEKHPVEQIDYLGQPYDYDSIMHYGPNLFSINGQDTIRPVASARARGVILRHTAGNRLFSEIDIKELNALACSGGGATTTTTRAPVVTTTTRAPVVSATTRARVTNCVDESPYCSSWGTVGFCTYSQYVDYMAINCVKTCGKC